MNKIIMSLIVIVSCGSAFADNLQIRCSSEMINNKKVKVSIYEDANVKPNRYALYISMNGVKYFSGYVSINADENLIITDDRVNGYNVRFSGQIYPSGGDDSSVTLFVSPIASADQGVSGKFSCSSLYNW